MQGITEVLTTRFLLGYEIPLESNLYTNKDQNFSVQSIKKQSPVNKGTQISKLYMVSEQDNTV